MAHPPQKKVPNMIPGPSQTCPKIIRKLSENDPKTIRNRSENDPKTDRTRSENDPQTTPADPLNLTFPSFYDKTATIRARRESNRVPPGSDLPSAAPPTTRLIPPCPPPSPQISFAPEIRALGEPARFLIIRRQKHDLFFIRRQKQDFGHQIHEF